MASGLKRSSGFLPLVGDAERDLLPLFFFPLFREGLRLLLRLLADFLIFPDLCPPGCKTRTKQLIQQWETIQVPPQQRRQPFKCSDKCIKWFMNEKAYHCENVELCKPFCCSDSLITRAAVRHNTGMCSFDGSVDIATTGWCITVCIFCLLCNEYFSVLEI